VEPAGKPAAMPKAGSNKAVATIGQVRVFKDFAEILSIAGLRGAIEWATGQSMCCRVLDA
jgi:hypothetical protein